MSKPGKLQKPWVASVRRAWLLVLVLCSPDGLRSAQNISLSGKYRLTTYDLSTGKPRAHYESEFSYSQKDGGWKVEVKDNPLVPGLEWTQWVWEDGVMYHTDCSASREPNVIQRIMAVTTNSLPDFGWHCAIPLLLVFDPNLVLQQNPPSIPRITFLPFDQGQPSRVWCQLDGPGPSADYPFINLRAYGERSLYAPAASSPTQPKDPLLLFECKISKFASVQGHFIPQGFYFRACYPRGTASPEDVTTSWDVSGEVGPDASVSNVPSLLKIEGKTLVVDYRIPVPGNMFASYYTTNSLLATNSTQLENLRRDRTRDAALGITHSTKPRVILAAMILFSLVFAFFILFHTRQQHAENKHTQQ
jgi:hypothetical protein